MNILENIIAHKRKEVQERKEIYPVKFLERSIFFNAPAVSLKEYLLNKEKSGIIAEIKRMSPSLGSINKYISIEKTSIGYMQAGASALSILTDKEFFGGSNEDLSIARKFNYCPILRKDFIIDEYQVTEAKSIGADIILLIAAVLTKKEIRNFAKLAASLQLEVLFEIRNKEDIEKINEYIQYAGVNNRNLDDFSVNVQQSFDLAEFIPNEFVKISESGISDPKIIAQLKNAGYSGFLIGEIFMKHSRPEEACKEFIMKLSQAEKIQKTI